MITVMLSEADAFSGRESKHPYLQDDGSCRDSSRLE